MIESVAIMVDETAAATGEVVLFEDGDVEAGASEAGCGADAANAGADYYRGRLLR